jgi:hypothetical protein
VRAGRQSGRTDPAIRECLNSFVDQFLDAPVRHNPKLFGAGSVDEKRYREMSDLGLRHINYVTVVPQTLLGATPAQYYATVG